MSTGRCATQSALVRALNGAEIGGAGRPRPPAEHGKTQFAAFARVGWWPQMAQSMQVRVPNDPESVARARQATAEALEAWGIGTPVDATAVGDVLLVATELVSNAVKFSSGNVALALTWSGRTVRVGVTDTSPSRAALGTAAPDATGGRGLAIVAALSGRWGQTPYEGGRKEVWAEVQVGPGAGAAGMRGAATVGAAEG